MSKAEIDAERINWLVKTFGEVSIGTQIDFLRWMDDREAVLVAALDEAREILAVWLIGVEYPESLKAYSIIDNALKEYRGER